MNNLNSNWDIWYHAEKDNWKLSGYKNIYKITSINSFWQFYNNWNKIDNIINKHFFLMKENINPIWEDPKNINGGCWSFKIHDDQAEELWAEISIYLVCEILCPSISNEIVGVSICFKKNNIPSNYYDLIKNRFSLDFFTIADIKNIFL